jgi:nucleotide-binding universal stress UspA family protein
MTMFQHLLVPLDGSRLAETAVPAAAALAASLGAGLILLHVVEPEAPAQVHGDRHLKTPQEAQAYLDDLVAWAAARGVSARARVEIGRGDVAARICREASGADADLIVLCTHGGRGVRGLLFGRVAQQVLARGGIPVFLMPPSPHGRDAEFLCRRLLVPLDGSSPSEAVLPYAASFARALESTLVLESVIPTLSTIHGARGATARLLPRVGQAVLDEEATDAAAYLQTLVSRLEADGLDVEGVVERGEPVKVLEAAAARPGTDAFAMATHARAGVSAIWEGSIAARLMERSGRPILLVRIRN